jgi:hypothetical protein
MEWNLNSTSRRLVLVWFIHSFIHLVACLTTGIKPLPKRALHIVRSRASSFTWQYPFLSLRSSTSFQRLLPRLPTSYIPFFIFPSIICCRWQFLRKMWPIQLAFRLLVSCRIFLCSLTLNNIVLISHMIGLTDIFHPSPAPHFKTFQMFLIVCRIYGKIKFVTQKIWSLMQQDNSLLFTVRMTRKPRDQMRFVD